MQQFDAKTSARENECEKVGRMMKMKENIRQNVYDVVGVVHFPRVENVDRVNSGGRSSENEADR